MTKNHDDEEIHNYGEEYIDSANAPVPKWLIASYILLPIWGVASFMLYWNGSHGWLDRGYWQELQQVSNTTIPQRNVFSAYGPVPDAPEQSAPVKE